MAGYLISAVVILVIGAVAISLGVTDWQLVGIYAALCALSWVYMILRSRRKAK